MQELDNVSDSVVVIGAGLAGLTAAATAAREKKPVTVVEAHIGGGRARTDERDGYRFNQGPHALYRSGRGWRILRGLKVAHRGHQPPLRGARITHRGELVHLPGAAMGSLLAKLFSASPAKWTGRCAEEWVQSLGGAPEVAELARMVIRVVTYVADHEHMPADLAISQAKLGLRGGVSYLDGGWSTLVDGLASAASSAGAAIRIHESAIGIERCTDGWEVTLAGGEVLSAGAVVVAAGGPDAARRLLPVEPAWPELGPPVTAACLDLGLQRCHPPVVFGLDEPLYLSRHSPPGDLAPEGKAMVHVMRYGARDARLDRTELRTYARLAGIGDDHIVEERFLAGMVVTHLLPGVEHGLAGRPAVEVPGAPGIYLAGDWVGTSGWLADAAMASGQRAGLLAARAPSHRPLRPTLA
jgi:phytoene dehydrogenase-like protein